MKYQLQSSTLMHAPGMVRWAMNGYAFKRDQPQMIEVITQTWNGVTDDAARKLLSREVPFQVEGDTVVFEA